MRLAQVQIAHVERAKRTIQLRQPDHLAADGGRLADAKLNLPRKSHRSQFPQGRRRAAADRISAFLPAASPAAFRGWRTRPAASPAAGPRSCTARTASRRGFSWVLRQDRRRPSGRSRRALGRRCCAGLASPPRLQQRRGRERWQAIAPIAAPVDQVVANLQQHHQRKQIRKAGGFGGCLP